MDKAGLVSGFQCFGDLLRYRQRLVNRNWTALQSLLKRLTLDQLHHDASRIVGFFEAVDLGNVWMVQRGEDLSFTLEARETIGIVHEMIRQKFQCDLALQLCVGERETRLPFRLHLGSTSRETALCGCLSSVPMRSLSQQKWAHRLYPDKAEECRILMLIVRNGRFSSSNQFKTV